MQPTTPNLSITAIRAMLSEQFPDLALTDIIPIAEGGDFQTVRVDDALIFRFSRDEPTARGCGVRSRRCLRCAPPCRLSSPPTHTSALPPHAPPIPAVAIRCFPASPAS